VETGRVAGQRNIYIHGRPDYIVIVFVNTSGNVCNDCVWNGNRQTGRPVCHTLLASQVD
jgi:hypothetical protein